MNGNPDRAGKGEALPRTRPGKRKWQRMAKAHAFAIAGKSPPAASRGLPRPPVSCFLPFMTSSLRFRRPLPVAVFTLAALAPLPLFALGLWAGGGWVWAGFLYMAGLPAVLDRLTPHVAGDAAEGQEFPGSDTLLLAVGLSALALLPLAAWAVAGASGLSGPGRVLIFLGAGLWLGQVGHPAAHELIHRGNRKRFLDLRHLLRHLRKRLDLRGTLGDQIVQPLADLRRRPEHPVLELLEERHGQAPLPVLPHLMPKPRDGKGIGR